MKQFFEKILFRKEPTPDKEWPITQGVMLKMYADRRVPGHVQLLLAVEGDATGDARKSIDLGLCPRNTTVEFQPATSFASDPEAGHVLFNPETLLDPRNIFALLHEIGHVVMWRETRTKYPAKANEVLAIVSEKRQYEDTDALQKPLPFERDAWAEAVRIARHLQTTHRVNLFRLFSGADDFMGWLRATGLRTYEHDLEQAGIKAYSKCGVVMRWLEKEQQSTSLLSLDEINSINRWSQETTAHKGDANMVYYGA